MTHDMLHIPDMFKSLGMRDMFLSLISHIHMAIGEAECTAVHAREA